SNAPADSVVLLPLDADASARRLRAALSPHPPRPAVVIADSFGRAWRIAQCDVAIGIAGLAPVDDWNGRADRSGRALQATASSIVVVSPPCATAPSQTARWRQSSWA